MLEHASTDHRNISRRIKNRRDRPQAPCARECGLVLGVEKARIRHGHMHRPARRSTVVVPRSTRPSPASCGKSSATCGRGSSMAWQRWVPARSLASMCARKMPWSISMPSLSRCSFARFAQLLLARRVSPGTALAASMTSASSRRNSERLCEMGHRVLRRAQPRKRLRCSRALASSAVAAAASASLRLGFCGSRCSRSSQR